jgi:prepilin-type processing-associated H-X9-DG protein
VRTYERLKGLVEGRPDLVQWSPILNLANTPSSAANYLWADGAVKSLAAKDLPGDYSHGTECQTLMMNAPAYVLYLGELARSRGITMVRKRLTSLDEAYTVCGRVDLVVNATGLGAQTLVGIADPTVYPARGVTVLARAPKVTRAAQVTDVFKAAMAGGAPPPPTYILPRPGTDGHVILGGTYDADNYSPLPSTEIVEGILQRNFALDPNLAPGGTWRDIEVLSVNVGLRPARKAGQRVELERRRIGDGATGASPTASLADRGRSVGVIHAYGFGGVG